MSDEPTRTRRLSRFSPVTLFLLATILALAITVLLLWREVGLLRAQVSRFETDLGRLHVTDAERPHVIAVRTDEPLTWRWRVYLPPLLHGKYHFNFYEGGHESFTAENLNQLLNRLRQGSPNYEFRGSSAIPQSGELTIEAKLVNRDGHWFLEAQPLGETRLAFPDAWKEMLKDLGLPDQEFDEGAWTDKAEEFAGVNTKRQMIFGRGDVVPLLLLQGPPAPFAGSKSPKTGPAGQMSAMLMLWIDNTP